MNPECSEQRNAHACPNSFGWPIRPAGIADARFAASASGVVPFFWAENAKPLRSRSVSNAPGRILLIVTLEAATVRATPARNAVSPARAPDERSRPGIGAYTDVDVMLTMRPNRRSTIP